MLVISPRRANALCLAALLIGATLTACAGTGNAPPPVSTLTPTQTSTPTATRTATPSMATTATPTPGS